MSRRGPSRWDNNHNSGRDHTTGGGNFRQQRQRQREDHRPAPYNTQRPTAGRGARPPQGVSDEDAIQALLQSAQQREQEKKRSDTRSRRPDSDRNRGSNGQQRPPRDQQLPENESYYGPAPGETDRSDKGVDGKEKDKNDEESSSGPPAQKPNFGLSGALAKDSGGTAGNMYKGIQLKFHEPPEARAPNTQWRFYVFKGKDQLLETLHISKQSAYLMGRQQEICDIPMAHPSLSSQHAVLQYRALPHPTTQRLSCKPYIMDLESTNGTFLNSVRLDPARYYELKKGDVLTFGASTREYVLMTENTTGSSIR